MARPRIGEGARRFPRSARTSLGRLDGQAKLDDELPERSSGSTSPRFWSHRRSRAASSSPTTIRASEPPMNVRRSGRIAYSGITTLDGGSLVAPRKTSPVTSFRWQQPKKAQRVQGEALPPKFSRLLVRRLPDGSTKRRRPQARARDGRPPVGSRLFCETNPMCVPVAAASGDQEEAMWRSRGASATDLSFLHLDCLSSLWDADPP